MSKSSHLSFEFTKRKRWADLLIHELSDAVVFVLSYDGRIWFSGHAVSELLGWSDAELIDRQFTDLVNLDDQHAFRIAFEESLRTRVQMSSYLRLKVRTPTVTSMSEVLFEVKGSPHCVGNEPTARYFVAVAKPYPSRNIAMLNTVLELKTENDRLQQQVAELRVRAPSPAPCASMSGSPPYSLRSPTISRTSALTAPLCSSGVPGGLYPPFPMRTPLDDAGSSGSHGSLHEPLGLHTYNGQYMAASSTQPIEDDLGDDASRRKKMRKAHNMEQHVCITCGRTDSPEWRKGPQGPKTLCNACGLRWAKEVRSKIDENPVVDSAWPASST